MRLSEYLRKKADEDVSTSVPVVAGAASRIEPLRPVRRYVAHNLRPFNYDLPAHIRELGQGIAKPMQLWRTLTTDPNMESIKQQVEKRIQAREDAARFGSSAARRRGELLARYLRVFDPSKGSLFQPLDPSLNPSWMPPLRGSLLYDPLSLAEHTGEYMEPGTYVGKDANLVYGNTAQHIRRDPLNPARTLSQQADVWDVVPNKSEMTGNWSLREMLARKMLDRLGGSPATVLGPELVVPTSSEAEEALFFRPFSYTSEINPLESRQHPPGQPYEPPKGVQPGQNVSIPSRFQRAKSWELAQWGKLGGKVPWLKPVGKFVGRLASAPAAAALATGDVAGHGLTTPGQNTSILRPLSTDIHGSYEGPVDYSKESFGGNLLAHGEAAAQRSRTPWGGALTGVTDPVGYVTGAGKAAYDIFDAARNAGPKELLSGLTGFTFSHKNTRRRAP